MDKSTGIGILMALGGIGLGLVLEGEKLPRSCNPLRRLSSWAAPWGR